MKILVTGATGFVGKRLLLMLRDKGHEVVVLTRDTKRARVRLPIHCTTFAWRPSEELPPVEAFDGVEAVVHLAGENIGEGRWSESRKKKIVDSRVLSTRHLARVLEQLGVRPKVFVGASAIGFYGDRGTEVMDETSTSGQGFLAQVCRDWEKEIFQIEELGVRTVALRFGVILGKDGGAMRMMLPPFRLGLGGRLGSGEQMMSWIHVEDVAGLVVHAIESEDVRGPVNAVSPHPASNREFTKTLGKELGRPTLIPVPAFLLKLGLGELSTLLLGSQNVSAEKAVQSGYNFLYPKLNLALRQICNHFDHELLVEQWFPLGIDKVWEFFSEAKNLEKLTPEFLGFQIVGQSCNPIEKGCRIDYKLKMHGIPLRWQSLILEWDPPNRFADSQTRGPYALWYHTHEFIEKDGGTLIRDRVAYRLPLDFLTDAVAHPFVRKDLEKIFLYRIQVADEVFSES